MIQPSTGQVAFQGQAATKRARQMYLHADRLAQILALDDTPYLGNLPAPFLHRIGLSEDEALAFLDRLVDSAELLRLTHGQGARIRLRESGVSLPNTPQPPLVVHLKYMGGGSFSRTYGLTIKDKTFAFKVFLPHTAQDVLDQFRSGPYWESSMGVYYSPKSSDLAQFYAANPQKGWILSELIDKTTPIHLRSGPTLQEQGVAFGDEQDPKNRVHGIRVDYGHLTHSGRALESGAIERPEWMRKSGEHRRHDI